MDGRKVQLPELEGIVFLNINSWCGGCEMWVHGDEEHSSPPRSAYLHFTTFSTNSCLFCTIKSYVRCQAMLSNNIGQFNMYQLHRNLVYTSFLVSLHSINDGVLEVAGLYSALHIARLQVNMADPLRLGQARSIKVSASSDLVLQHHAFVSNISKTLEGIKPIYSRIPRGNENWFKKLGGSKNRG